MTIDSTAASSNAPASVEIIAEPDPGYRWKHLIMALIMIVGGVWFAYDGWKGWPEENVKINQLKKDKDDAQAANDTARVEALSKELNQHSAHTDLDILIQKLLALSLPLAGFAYGYWTWYSTRGMYRLEGYLLHAPGHPSVHVDNIRRLDKRKWDRKGIAYVHYERGNPPVPTVLKLDDFAYERKATDEILDRLEQHVRPEEPDAPSGNPQ